MLLIALTGSLATGKSTVSNLLRSPPYNLPIIDADLLARQVVEPGTTGYNRIVDYFSPTTPDLLLPPAPPAQEEEGKGGRHRRQERAVAAGGRALNRAALGRRVFGSEAGRVRDRQVLNGIVHPLVRWAMVREVAWWFVRGRSAVVLDVPLLYEGGLDVFAGVVVMVAVREAEVQMRRLRERDGGLSAVEAAERVGSQMGVEEKVGRTERRGKRRGKVVWNDGGKEELGGEVERVMGEIEREAGGLLWKFWLWQSPFGLLLVAAWEIWWGWVAKRGWETERKSELKKEK